MGQIFDHFLSKMRSKIEVFQGKSQFFDKKSEREGQNRKMSKSFLTTSGGFC